MSRRVLAVDEEMTTLGMVGDAAHPFDFDALAASLSAKRVHL